MDKWLRSLCALLVCASAVTGVAHAADLSAIPEIEARVALSAARPEYPYEARLQRLTGTGVAVMEVDTESGKVERAYMAISTGHKVLDQAAIEAFSRWRFRPGMVSRVKAPISFTMADGAGYYSASKPMDDVLAAFLGKGTVSHGPIPAYPRSAGWTNKQGKGVYELHAGGNGKIQQVRILKSSGDAVFDQETVKTLRRWRLRRGPLVLELPLSFKLTPTNYSVEIAR